METKGFIILGHVFHELLTHDAIIICLFCLGNYGQTYRCS